MPRRGLWGHPDFVKLWSGQTGSVFGSLVGQLALQFTAIIWLDASAAEVAILAGCLLVPGFVVSPIAGVWVDRWPRREAMVVADVGRCLALLTIPIAAVVDVLTVEQLFAVAIVMSVLNALFEIAYRSFLPEIVEPAQLIEGNSKLTASESVAEAAAFSSGGWLVQLVTAPGALLVDAASFAWSAARIAAIRHVRAAAPDDPSAERPSAGDDLMAGIRLVFGHPMLRTLAVANLLFAMASGTLGVVLLLYLVRDLDYAPGVLGLIFAVGGATSLVGATFAGRVAGSGWFGPGLILVLVGVGLGQLFLPLTAAVSTIGVILLVSNQLVTDPCWTMFNINELSLRQAVTPPGLQGRMNGLVRTLEAGGRVAGTALGGILGELIGFRETLFVGVAIFWLVPLWVLLSPVARLRQVPIGPLVDSEA